MLVSEARLQRLLTRVQRPGRYVGQEWNSVVKNWDNVQVTLALAYPDLYEIGMSNLGLAILYDLVNQREEFAAERVYAPAVDMEAEMRAAGMRLFSLETRHTIDTFDVIGISIQHELNYTDVLNMLDLGGIPLLARTRTSDTPLVIAGGSCTYNPEPLAEFFDVFVIGEGEEILLELLDCVREWKGDGGRARPHGRRELLLRLAQLGGVYVPSLYRVVYDDDDGTVAAIRPGAAEAPARVLKRILPRLGPAPISPILPSTRVVHDRGMVEIQRGCSHGCRFCQAGMIYRPIRERPIAEVLAAIDGLMTRCGYGEIGLLSLTSADHSGIKEIISQAMARHSNDGLAISLPSLRIDSFSVQLAEMIGSARRTGLTFAPEAGSQRLRDVINKGVREEDLLRTTGAAFASGWQRIKLYFMIGLPTETDEDVLEIARLIHEVRAQGRAIRRRGISINVSVSTFVPKPHTPFQWVPLTTRPEVERRQKLLQAELRTPGVHMSWSDWDSTWLEAVLSRGDRRLSAVVHGAWRMGARFDAWGEHFRPGLWQKALAQEGLSGAFYALRHREPEEIFPWEHIDVGVTRQFLWQEYGRSLEGKLSPDCRAQCHGCGIQTAFSDQRVGLPERAWGCP